jgi:hypothetical protein
MSKPIFYVYVLFDWKAIPRYVGKGRTNRWLEHENGAIDSNPSKARFVNKTIAVLGDLPKIKVAEDLFEDEAFKLEKYLIKTIGRFPNGPLTNRTDNRNGPSSERIKAWHASRTPEERKATIQKAMETIRRLYTVEECSERARKNALTQGKEKLSERARKT